MPQTMSHPSRPLVRTTLCILVLVFGCQATLSVRTASAAGSGSEAIQGLGSYFLTLPSCPIAGSRWPSPSWEQSPEE